MNAKCDILVMQNTISRKAGGLYFSVRYLMKSIAELNPNIFVCSLKDEFTSEDLKNWDPLEVKTFNHVGPKSYLYSSELKEFVNSSQCNLIHVNGIWQYPTRIAFSAFNKKSVPYIISPRGMLDPWALKNSRLKKKLVGYLFERRNLKNATCIHALCNSEYESIRKFGLTNPVAIVPNGIDIQAVPSPKLKGRNKRQLLFLGRLHKKKGLIKLIEAISIIDQNKSELLQNWEILIAGWDQNNYEKVLEKKTSSLKLGNYIKFIGPQFNEEKHRLLSSVDGFILPSYSEGLPMSILEAWSYGIPVIMTKECNLDAAFNNKAAIEITTESENIAKNIISFLEMKDIERYDYGVRGYHYAKQNYSWSSVSQQMNELYNWILDKAETPSFVRFD